MNLTKVCSAFLLFFFNVLFGIIYTQTTTIDRNWWRTAVIYQIYPKSFKDDNNDGYGDLRGVISKLPHLADAGVTAAWLSPIYSSPQVDDGYDISNFTNVWETFGTLEEFDELVTVAHGLNIKVVMDLVPNHSSDQHEWFLLSENRTSGYEDYYVWRNGTNSTSPPNNWISIFKYSAWKYSETRGQWYLHQFTEQQPDLNFRNLRVLEEMTSVVLFWLDRGVDGFRVDAIPHLFEDEHFRDEPESGNSGVEPYEYDYLTHIYTKDINDTYEVIYYWRELLDNYTNEHGGHERIMMVESSSELPKTMMYYTNGERDGAHFPFNFQVNGRVTQNSTASHIVSVIRLWLDNMPQGDYIPNWQTGNHDQIRAATRFGRNNIDGFNILNLMLPGVAITYNGEEIGMENGEVTWEQGRDPSACNGARDRFNSTSRDFARTPYHWDSTTNAGFNNGTGTWLPVSSKYLECNLASQNTNSNGKTHYQVYKKLTSLRKEPAFKNGNFEVAAVSTYVTGFTRILNESEGLVVLINTADSQATVNLTNSFSNLSKNLEIAVTSISSRKSEGDILQTDSITLSNYESLVLKLIVTPENNEDTSEDTSSGISHFSGKVLKIIVIVIFFNSLV